MSSPGHAAFHWLKHLLRIDAAATQVTSAEREALLKYAAGKKRLLEIGVFEGATTGVLARSMAADSVLIGVDPFLPGRLGICWSKGIAYRELRRRKPKGKVKFIQKFSFDAAHEVEGEFDFVFIDGDHSLEGIRRDWEDWSPRVRSGGVIALHDTRAPAHNLNVAAFGSVAYFESHICHDPHFELVEQIHSLSVLERR